MARTLKAVYQGGAFVPKEACDLAEGTEVELEIRPYLLPPTVTDPEERKRIMEALIENMRQNPIPEGAPRRFTREDLCSREHTASEDGSTAKLVGQRSKRLPPRITDPAERKRVLVELLERMQNNPIPQDAPRFTREELHERS